MGIEAEWMWAKPIDGMLFELDNAPFNLYGISVGDVLSARIADSVFEFDSLVKKSGWRTVRVRFPHGGTHKDFEVIWAPLEALGCDFEGSQEGRPLYAISVPPSTSLPLVIEYVSRLEEQGVLEYEEADCF